MAATPKSLLLRESTQRPPPPASHRRIVMVLVVVPSSSMTSSSRFSWTAGSSRTALRRRRPLDCASTLLALRRRIDAASAVPRNIGRRVMSVNAILIAVTAWVRVWPIRSPFYLHPTAAYPVIRIVPDDTVDGQIRGKLAESEAFTSFCHAVVHNSTLTDDAVRREIAFQRLAISFLGQTADEDFSRSVKRPGNTFQGIAVFH